MAIRFHIRAVLVPTASGLALLADTWSNGKVHVDDDGSGYLLLSDGTRAVLPRPRGGILVLKEENLTSLLSWRQFRDRWGQDCAFKTLVGRTEDPVQVVL